MKCLILFLGKNKKKIPTICHLLNYVAKRVVKVNALLEFMFSRRNKRNISIFWLKKGTLYIKQIANPT